MTDPVAIVHEFKELDKFILYTDAPDAPGKRSRLTWSTYRGNPRITVFTSVPNDSGKGIINAPMNPETFIILMNELERIAKNPGEEKIKLTCLTTVKREDGQRSQERTLLSDVWVGRDSAGIVWMSVIAEGRPKIKFEFHVSDFHKLTHGDGTAFSAAESSALQALAYVIGTRNAILPHTADIRPPYVPNGRAANSKPASAAVANTNFDDITF